MCVRVCVCVCISRVSQSCILYLRYLHNFIAFLWHTHIAASPLKYLNLISKLGKGFRLGFFRLSAQLCNGVLVLAQEGGSWFQGWGFGKLSIGKHKYAQLVPSTDAIFISWKKCSILNRALAQLSLSCAALFADEFPTGPTHKYSNYTHVCVCTPVCVCVCEL